MKKLILLSILLIVGCEEQIREVIIARHTMGEKKILVKYKGSGADEVIIERIFYNQNGDTIQLKQFSDNGEINVKWVYYDNGQLLQKEAYRNGKPIGTWKSFDREGKLIAEYWYGNGIKVFDAQEQQNYVGSGSVKVKNPNKQ